MAAEKFLKEAMIKKLDFVPTECQKNLFEMLGAFVMDDPSQKWLMMISGYAGTGKTTAIGAFIGVLETLKFKYILTKI